MALFLRRSASIVPSGSTRTLAALLRLVPSESFTSSSTSKLQRLNGSSASKKLGFCENPRRDFHFYTRSLGFRASDVARAGYAVQEESFLDEEENTTDSRKGGDEGLMISKLGIDPQIVESLAKRGITNLFPIQKAVLEPAMQGRDMIGRARTGTGKTLAFAIPIMNKIMQYNAKHGRGRNPLALALAPTRELAKQVEKEFKDSSPLDTMCVYGGRPIHEQMRTLDYGVDVVVGTPGRIIDLINRGSLNLSEVQFVVLDEADQMLSVGFDKDVEIILDKLPQKRQSMMFSATLPSWIRQLTQKYLKDPVTIDLVGENDQRLAEGITLYSIATDSYSKSSILGPLIKEHAKGGKCIVFTQTKRDADRMANALGRSFACERLHGDITQPERERTISGFRDGRFNILVATDVASRGLDIPNVDLVIHYELPTSSEIFVHRSGRTGRAGKKGSVILIYTQDQTRAVKGIVHDVKCKFTELPKIEVEGGVEDLFGGMGGGGGGRFGGGRMGGSGGGGGSGFGRSGSYGSSGRGGGGGGGGGYGGGGGGGGQARGGSSGSSSSSGRPGGDLGGSNGSGRVGSFGGNSNPNSSANNRYSFDFGSYGAE